MAAAESPTTFRKTENGRIPGTRAAGSTEEKSSQVQFETKPITVGSVGLSNTQVQIGVTVTVGVAVKVFAKPMLEEVGNEPRQEPKGLILSPRILPIAVSPPKIKLALPTRSSPSPSPSSPGPAPMDAKINANPDTQTTETYDCDHDFGQGIALPSPDTPGLVGTQSQKEVNLAEELEPPPLTACWSIMSPVKLRDQSPPVDVDGSLMATNENNLGPGSVTAAWCFMPE